MQTAFAICNPIYIHNHFPNAISFLGQFASGLKEGQGEFSSTDLSKYTGEHLFHQLFAREFAKEKFHHFDAGQFFNDKMEGFGTLHMPDGQVYVGQFSDWKRFGLGNLTYRNGDLYVGQWNDDEGNGTGTLIFHFEIIS